LLPKLTTKQPGKTNVYSEVLTLKARTGEVGGNKEFYVVVVS
jgi:hypothetical protein